MVIDEAKPAVPRTEDLELVRAALRRGARAIVVLVVIMVLGTAMGLLLATSDLKVGLGFAALCAGFGALMIVALRKTRVTKAALLAGFERGDAVVRWGYVERTTLEGSGAKAAEVVYLFDAAGRAVTVPYYDGASAQRTLEAVERLCPDGYYGFDEELHVLRNSDHAAFVRALTT